MNLKDKDIDDWSVEEIQARMTEDEVIDKMWRSWYENPGKPEKALKESLDFIYYSQLCEEDLEWLTNDMLPNFVEMMETCSRDPDGFAG
jgi:hypothetical protein